MNKRLVLAALMLASAMRCIPAYAGTDTLDTCRLHTLADSIDLYLSPLADVRTGITALSFHLGKGKKLSISFSRELGEHPLRQADIERIYGMAARLLPSPYNRYDIEIYSGDTKIEDLANRYFSGLRYPYGKRKKGNATAHVEELTRPFSPSEGLEGRHIALWQSHGYYYNEKENRWKWQRAPFFTTIEDMLTYSYAVDYLAPMLENAGARVYMPRERDAMKREIIIDYGSRGYSETSGGRHGDLQWQDAPGTGFAYSADTCITEGNPFTAGNARMIAAVRNFPATAQYFPDFPETGEYAVYISYKSLPESPSSVLYTVRHAGGESVFSVNQKMGGGTWIYLGTFTFSYGYSGQGVIVQNIPRKGKKMEKGAIVTTDAVRFGGGMGNISRGQAGTSGFPRFAEAARYWLQWAGFPEKVYTPEQGTDDYKDDYQSRGLWVNSLRDDFGIPADIAVALHTDAGIAGGDSTTGTLAIYTKVSDNKDIMADGTSRLASRELADIIQTTVVNDIRSCYDHAWNRRGLWDRPYTEARYPDVPAVLIEMLSHQNINDMRLALDPHFRFILARGIYKGILRFLSFRDGIDCSVQPLPPRLISAIADKSDSTVRLSWRETIDRSEPTAAADSYIVYTMSEIPGESTGAFDNGIIVNDTVCSMKIEAGRIYSYRVAAVNAGGISFPSGTLSAGLGCTEKEILIINAFDKTSAPTDYGLSIPGAEGFSAGGGIPYMCDYSYTGDQYCFDRSKVWVHDDRPGFGASYINYAPERLAGNSFDYPSVHGAPLAEMGITFSSAVPEALDSGLNDISSYDAVDIIYGREDAGAITESMMDVLGKYRSTGGKILMSGSNIGRDIFDGICRRPVQDIPGPGTVPDSSGSDKRRQDFIRYLFGVEWSNSDASPDGMAYLESDRDTVIMFHTRPNSDVYNAAPVDAYLPVTENTVPLLRYTDGNTVAATIYSEGDYRGIIMGFPIETIASRRQIGYLLREAMSWLFE